MSGTSDFHGIEVVRLNTPKGASAIIALEGAQVVSWIPSAGGERLYLSERAVFRTGHPIRGGIPVIFPQFSHYGSGQRHGFARLRRWRLLQQRQQDNFATASFLLESDETTQLLWPHTFSAELTVMIEDNRLDVELEIINGGNAPFEFTAALHTYLRMNNIELARLEGLEDLTYSDATSGNVRQKDNYHALFVDSEVDRLYFGVKNPLLVTETGRLLAIDQSGFRDLVVWNPWETRTASITDMAPADFKHMLCVEAAIVHPPVALVPGEDWCGRQSLLAL